MQPSHFLVAISNAMYNGDKLLQSQVAGVKVHAELTLVEAALLSGGLDKVNYC